jgi:hypothetical protein
MRHTFNLLNSVYSKYYASSEHLAADEVILLFKGKVILKNYVPKEHKRFGMKVHKFCDMPGLLTYSWS